MRASHLDGLRGLAALTVVFCHLVCAFAPGLYFGSSANPLQDDLSRSLVFVFYSGTFAVYVFFVLSGFVISSSAAKKTESIFDTIGKRYLRLAIPALSSGVFAYALWCFFPGVTQRLGELLPNGWLMTWYSGPPPRPLIVGLDPIFNCFRFGWAAINRVLWTMQAELFGSVSIYIAYRLIPSRFLLPFFIACLLVLIPLRQPLISFIGFPAGAIIFQISQTKYMKSSALGFLLIIGGLLLGSLPQQENVGAMFHPIVSMMSGWTDPNTLTLTLGATMMLTGVLLSSPSRVILSAGIPVFLGRISFMLYLLHAPLIMLPGIALVLFLGTSVPVLLYVSSLLLIAAIGFAFLFTVCIDETLLNFLRRRPSIRLTKRVAILMASEWVVFGMILAYYLLRIGFDPLGILILTISNFGALFIVKCILVRVSAHPTGVQSSPAQAI